LIATLSTLVQMALGDTTTASAKLQSGLKGEGEPAIVELAPSHRVPIPPALLNSVLWLDQQVRNDS
jgi:hypothetical protein